MSEILLPFKVYNTSGELTNASQIELDSTGFSGNLDSSTNNVQDLANTVDTLSVAAASGIPYSVGGLSVSIPTRINLNTNISGDQTVRFRLYNHAQITSLSLFISNGGLFSTVPMTVPDSDGEHTEILSIPTQSTSSQRTIVFYIVANNRYVSGSYQVEVDTIEASEVTVDNSSLTSVQATNVQQVATELERLYAAVAQMNAGGRPTERELVTFSSAVTINSGNIDQYNNRNAIYVASIDQRIGFQLPTEASISQNDYPVVFEITHLGGTQRFDTGFNPNNTIQIRRPTDFSAGDPSSFLRRDSETGTSLQFSGLHMGDTAIVRKEDSNSPWVVRESAVDPRSSILPSGVFRMNSRTVGFPTNVNGDHFVGGLSLYTPIQGDAFEVAGSGITIDSTFGREIATGDVIVAKIDSPNRLLTADNDDWLIIKDSSNSELSLTELRFLSNISETDHFTYERAEERSDVNSVRVWLSPYILDHAPFINPTTDPDNPQSGETDRYIGGDELDTSTADFRYTGTPSRLPNWFLYIDIDGSISADELNRIYVRHKDSDGNVFETFSLRDDFRQLTLPGAADTYYVLDTFQASDTFSGITFNSGQELSVDYRVTNRRFELSDNIDVIDSIHDGDITLSKIDPTVQALITSDTSITQDQAQKLAGLNLDNRTSELNGHEDLYVKLDSASSTNDLSHYVNVQQQNGIIPNYDRTRNVFFLVDANITVNQLQKVEVPTTKLAVTRHGAITTTTASPLGVTHWIGYSATLPAITGANNPLENAWQVDGNRNASILSGAIDDFKVRLANLDQSVLDRIGSNNHNNEYTLPDNLQRLSRDLTINDRAVSGWRALGTPSNLPKLTRQFAFGWDENRRTFGNDNYFSDLQGVEFISYQANNIFYYNTPNDPLNTSFPGAQSYIDNAPVRVRNRSGESVISSSHKKIIAFDYSLQRTLTSSDNVPMVRLGNTSTTPLLALAHDEGLYLNIGRGDGGTQSRTYQVPLQVLGGQWGTRVGETTTGEAEVIIPNDLSGSLTIEIDIQLMDDGNDEGTHAETITITNVGADQDLGQRTFDFTGFPSVTTNITYEHNNTDLSSPRRVLFLRPTVGFNNAALVYNVQAHRNITETWSTSTTYARRPVDAGSGHDDYGLFDPSYWNTEHVQERNRVVLMLRTYRDNDTSADPEMAVQMIVDGETEGSASERNIIRLHRPASDFMFNDILIGNFIVATSHIQAYDYDEESLVTENVLLNYYNNANRWFGLFTNASEHIDQLVFNAELEVQYESGVNRGVIIASPDGTRYRITVSDTGAISASEVT